MELSKNKITLFKERYKNQIKDISQNTLTSKGILHNKNDGKKFSVEQQRKKLTSAVYSLM